MQPSDLKHLFETNFPYIPTLSQKELFSRFADYVFRKESRSIFILKGYAGTGKTTVISTFVNLVSRLNKKAVLLAPTGRAAKVFSTYSGQNAFTIHKKIYQVFQASNHTFEVRLGKNIHKDSIFFVDEASMISGAMNDSETLFGGHHLLEDLMNYVFSGKNCQLVLMGDIAQLPPVGSEISPALDIEYLKRTFQCEVTQFELKEVVRQSLQSGILANANAIRQNKILKGIHPILNIIDFADVKSINGETLEEQLSSAYSSIEGVDAVVITRSNKRANVFNQEIRKRILFREDELSAGDILMSVKNNYFWLDSSSRSGFIANGDMMEVVKVLRIEELYGQRFADVIIRLTDYPEENDLRVKIMLDTLMLDGPSLSDMQFKQFFQEVMQDYADIPSGNQRIRELKANPYFNALQVKFAYALTCHKTQGGQWSKVFIDLGYLTEEHVDVYFYRWLYTAFTRATTELCLINFPAGFFKKN